MGGRMICSKSKIFVFFQQLEVAIHPALVDLKILFKNDSFCFSKFWIFEKKIEKIEYFYFVFFSSRKEK